MLKLLKLFLILSFYVFNVQSVKEVSEDVSSNSFASMFMNTIWGLFDMFQYKKIEKSREIPIVNTDPASKGKYLTENLHGDMMTLLNENKISDPKAGKLLAILENIEAIEINLKMANEYEYRANKLCSLYFPEIDQILEQEDNSGLSINDLLQKYISRFTNNHFEKSDSEGLYITRHLSRNSDLEEDKSMMEFVIQHMEDISKNRDQYHLADGSFSEVFTLPDDSTDFPKKVLKVMDFKNSYFEDMKNKVVNEEPILDLILLMIKRKRSYFEQVVTEIEVNAKTNHFKRQFDTDILPNDPSDNADFVNFFGCLNKRWTLNYKQNPSFRALQKIKQSYSKQLLNPSNIRDLKFEDLEDIIENRSIDLTLQGMTSSVDEVPLEYKIQVLNNFFWDLNLYEDYQFIFVFERMELDLFNDIFQKMYLMGASSLEERLTFYTMIASKVHILHQMGYRHCDLKDTNFLYKIVPKSGLFFVEYDNFRIIDFGSTQMNTRFCKGGTLGYLAPEVEHPLQVPHDQINFVTFINSVPDKSQFIDHDFGTYDDIVQYFQTQQNISIPQDYVDFRTVIENGAFNRPECFQDWINLLSILSDVFESIKIVHKIEYNPDPSELIEGSDKLKLLSDIKLKHKSVTGKTHEEQIIEKTQNMVKNKQEFIVRELKRQTLREGQYDYDADVIAKLNTADTFSLGIFFNEVETALNSNPIFEMFKKVENEHLNTEVLDTNLIDPINNTFQLKMSRNGLPNDLKDKVRAYFKNDQDMEVSYKQYSSEYKLVFGKEIEEFGKLLKDLNVFIVKMVSYFAYDRPSMDEVIQKMVQMKSQLEELKKTNMAYRTKMNVINTKIRRTVASFLKTKYKSIYGLRRLVI